VDKTVYVIGTLHRYQGTYNIKLRATATKGELQQFKRFLKEIVCQHRIRTVAEEMSVEPLQKYPHPDLPPGESIPRQVAKDLNLPYKDCDNPICPTTIENLFGCGSYKILTCFHVYSSSEAITLIAFLLS
jgi:hypothetical protein